MTKQQQATERAYKGDPDVLLELISARKHFRDQVGERDTDSRRQAKPQDVRCGGKSFLAAVDSEGSIQRHQDHGECQRRSCRMHQGLGHALLDIYREQADQEQP